MNIHNAVRDAIFELISRYQSNITEETPINPETLTQEAATQGLNAIINTIKSKTICNTTPCSIDELFSFLRSKEGNEEQFLELLRNCTLDVNKTDGHSTLLQYSCMNGWVSATKLLIEKGANLHKTTKINPKTAVQLVVEYGNYELFAELLRCPKFKIDLQDFISWTNLQNYDKISDNHRKCCELLLGEIEKNPVKYDYHNRQILVNSMIHYAVKYSDDTIVRQLLKLGASLNYCNSLDELPIEEIEPTILENHLDNCIKFESKPDCLDKSEFMVAVDYNCFITPQNLFIGDIEEGASERHKKSQQFNDTFVLEYMTSANRFKYLLTHPVIISFLLMKWRSIKWLYCLIVLGEILSLSAVLLLIFLRFTSEETDVTPGITASIFTFILKTAIYFIIFLRICSEFLLLMYLLVRFKSLKQVERWLALFLCIFIVILLAKQSEYAGRPIAGIIILLITFKFTLLLSYYQKFSTNIAMFKLVIKNFFILLLQSSILFLGFASSFFILYRKNDASADDQDFNTFGKTLLKIIVMFVGEFDASSFDFDTYPRVSRLIFVLFVFMVSVILMNLISGMAISNIQAIQDNAEIVAATEMIHRVYNVEKLLNAVRDCFSLFTRFNFLFRDEKMLRANVLYVFPNAKGRILCNPLEKITGNRCVRQNLFGACLDSETLRKLNLIIRKRRQKTMGRKSFLE